MLSGDYAFGTSLGIVNSEYTDRSTGEVKTTRKVGLAIDSHDQYGNPVTTNRYFSLNPRADKMVIADINASKGKPVGIPFSYAMRKGNSGMFLSEDYDVFRPITAATKPVSLVA